jgi:hypothetical protein
MGDDSFTVLQWNVLARPYTGYNWGGGLSIDISSRVPCPDSAGATMQIAGKRSIGKLQPVEYLCTLQRVATRPQLDQPHAARRPLAL